jgi:8-amino-7-oxononanoate synthase
MKYSRPDPLTWMDKELSDLAERGLRRNLSAHRGPQRACLQVDGRELINFGSNDYLGLAADARLAEAAARTADEEGCGAGASPLVTGRGATLERLERRLAEFEQTPAALVFASGYAANVGSISALAEPADAIYADQHNHASMIDGCRLSRAAVHIYPHRDWRALEDLLRAAGAYRRRLIATESVFSMDGDVAPLVELADLAERFDAMLLVDEAHATGVFGIRGSGLAEQFGVDNRVHVRVGTLSKALGSAGGFVCGSESLIAWLANRARPYIFSTAPPPPTCAAALAAIEIVCSEPWRRAALLESAAALRDELVRQGWQTLDSASQIIPLVVGEPQQAIRLSDRLRQAGLLVPAIRPPSVPPGKSLVRISLSCGHTSRMIEALIRALSDARTDFAGCSALG